MRIVVNDPTHVERELRARRLSCPHCGGELHPWGHARRRVLRGATADEEHRPRRARCSNCLVTSVLLPDICLSRRVDEVAVIGRALLEKVAGAGHRTIAIRLGRPKETVRGWLRRFSSRIGLIQAHFRHWAFTLDPRLESVTPQDSLFAGVLETIGLATRGVGDTPLLLAYSSTPWPLRFFSPRYFLSRSFSDQSSSALELPARQPLSPSPGYMFLHVWHCRV